MSRWKPGTKRHAIEKLVSEGHSRLSAENFLRPLVVSQTSPWIFRANVNGSRIVKPMSEQLIELKNEVGRVFAILGKSEDFGEDFVETMTENMPSETEELDTLDEIAESAAEVAEEESEEIENSTPAAAGKKKQKSEKEFFFSEWKRIKAWCEERALQADPIDAISMRPILAAKSGIPNGIPARALLAAMTLHWPEDVREAAGILPYDFRTLSDSQGEDAHELTGYALRLAKSRIPCMLVGPAGSGKSHIASQVAEFLGLPYGETPMTAGATPSWLLGSWTMQGFTTRSFLEIYSGGGVFNFEEIDASDPNMLLVANNALASKRLFNPVNGEVYERHPDFIPFATANTFGLGANRDFTARERLDAATIDRWRMGRIFVPIDEKLAERILFS